MIQQAFFELPLAVNAFSGAIVATLADLPPTARNNWVLGFTLVGVASSMGAAKFGYEGLYPDGLWLGSLSSAHRALADIARYG